MSLSVRTAVGRMSPGSSRGESSTPTYPPTAPGEAAVNGTRHPFPVRGKAGSAAHTHPVESAAIDYRPIPITRPRVRALAACWPNRVLSASAEVAAAPPVGGGAWPRPWVLGQIACWVFDPVLVPVALDPGE
jgi:hypothetical protein